MDGILPLDAEGAEMLSDAFDVLSLKEIKLSAMRGPVERDEQQDDEQLAMANAVMQVAQKKLISQVLTTRPDGDRGGVSSHLLPKVGVGEVEMDVPLLGGHWLHSCCVLLLKSSRGRCW